MRIELRHPTHAQDTAAVMGSPERQLRVPGAGMLQLVYQRGDEGGLAAVRETGNGQPQLPVERAIEQVRCMAGCEAQPVLERSHDAARGPRWM